MPLVLAATFVAGGAVGGMAATRPDVRLLAARGALVGVDARIDRVSGALDALERRATLASADLSALRDVLGAADARLRERRGELERQTARSTRIVTTGSLRGLPTEPTTLAELRAPLRVVSKAIHANDELGTALLDQQDEAHRRIAEARALLADLREAGFRLAEQERAIRAELTEAMAQAAQISAVGGDLEIAEEAERIIDRARSELRRIDVARLELRAREAELLRESAEIQQGLVDVREGIREVRRTTEDLYAQMTVAELLVSSRLVGWSEGALDAVEVAVDGVLRVCPVDEPMAYSDNWHAPRWGGGFHLHQGIDIFAPPGTPIRAPFDGTAVAADNTLGGIAVKVYGETGYVYNAHLTAYGTLGAVEAGDVVGFVGSTGNASGPHDHFEYHPGGGEAVNPYPFLNAVC